jgi:hypothetical protein
MSGLDPRRYDPPMGTYLAIYNGAASDQQKQELTSEQQDAFMHAWSRWAQAQGGALLDPGAPLYRKRRVTSTGVTEFEDAKTGYAILEADSIEDAVEAFSTHPHLSLLAENWIEVIECPSLQT